MPTAAMNPAGSYGTLKLCLAWVSVVWYISLLSLGLLGCRAAYEPTTVLLASADASSVPGVSILRPLKGLDTNLYENLESTFTQDYPNYEIFLCVADENDQALPIVRDLMAKYPNVNAHLMIGEENVGVNPKINNLMRSYRAAANDILWVLDSNVMVASGTLAHSVEALDGPADLPSSRRRIALVHHVPFAWSSEYALGSHIEEAFLNTNHAKMYVAINTVAIDSCVMGKSNLYRRSDLERVDGSLKPIADAAEGGSQPGPKGLAAFGRFLAEDNMIAAALWHELGLRHDLSCDVARNAVGNMSLPDYIWRRVRWIRVRKHMVLAATLLEPFTEGVMAGCLAAIGLHYLFGTTPWLFLPLHFACTTAISVGVHRRMGFRELLAFPIWAFAIVGSEVEWRGRRYQVLRNGRSRGHRAEARVLWGGLVC
ncbi:glycosyltransferase family 21 protein [Fomitopsis serialis]|uniref:glycosyltransferase family 21 protein n=1 Tax=Fomitopsis serialis TaxID=139415 RepID=UPI00200893C6|nr:glycosyltransferase family 21 protein [Neoantrodia serialis]KAH9937264.1 glycosyltransferase family 21 protein [Neoantrodia serialis]